MQNDDDLFAPQSKKRNPLVMVGKHLGRSNLFGNKQQPGYYVL